MKLITIIRKALVLILGGFLVIVGLILVPLPGPGLLVLLGGFLILSLEFSWAKQHKETLHKKLKQLIDKAKEKPTK